jgi:hypothetical protein
MMETILDLIIVLVPFVLFVKIVSACIPEFSEPYSDNLFENSYKQTEISEFPDSIMFDDNICTDIKYSYLDCNIWHQDNL